MRLLTDMIYTPERFIVQKIQYCHYINGKKCMQWRDKVFAPLLIDFFFPAYRSHTKVSNQQSNFNLVLFTLVSLGDNPRKIKMEFSNDNSSYSVCIETLRVLSIKLADTGTTAIIFAQIEC